MTRSSRIAVYGAGGFGREVLWLAEDCGYEVAAFIDDAVSAMQNGVPVMTLEEVTARHGDIAVAPAIGAPRARADAVRRVREAGLRLATLIHPRVERSRWLEVGEGVVVCAGGILSSNVTLEDDVQLEMGCTIGHDAILEQHATLAPGVHISGWVRVEEGAYIGTGAVVINGTEAEPLSIGRYAVIGAGACVTKSIPAGVTAVGVPARPLVASEPASREESP